MVLKLRGRLTFKVQGFVTVLFDMELKQLISIYFTKLCLVTVLFDMELKHQITNVLDTLCLVTVLIDIALKHKMYIMHLLGVFYFTVSHL
ncbi:Uncharacterised protein [Streptococcus salivarius]|nr:Uncharacterised protein [Streptococcus salivarius]VUW83587.1 Uncharacterised protein [Streptococcus thermophilus]